MYRLVCPRCGKSDGVVEVVYGLVDQAPEDACGQPEFICGGCMFDEGNPTHYCMACEIWILKQRGREAEIVEHQF